MLNKLNDIDDYCLSILTDKTTADDNVYMNKLVPLAINDDEEGQYIYGYFLDDETNSHDNYSSEYDLQCNYVFECFVISKNINTILTDARALAHSVQQILLKNENVDGLYSELTYQKTTTIKETDRNIPLVGLKLRYSLRYLAGLN